MLKTNKNGRIGRENGSKNTPWTLRFSFKNVYRRRKIPKNFHKIHIVETLTFLTTVLNCYICTYVLDWPITLSYCYKCLQVSLLLLMLLAINNNADTISHLDFYSTVLLESSLKIEIIKKKSWLSLKKHIFFFVSLTWSIARNCEIKF
jgi:hypothetical protein